MDTFKYLEQLVYSLDSLDTQESITNVMRELDDLFDALDPQYHQAANELKAELAARLEALG